MTRKALYKCSTFTFYIYFIYKKKILESKHLSLSKIKQLINALIFVVHIHYIHIHILLLGKQVSDESQCVIQVAGVGSMHIAGFIDGCGISRGSLLSSLSTPLIPHSKG